MTNTDRLIGNLEKGVAGLEESVAEIKVDIKKLLAAHNHSRGVIYTISAFIGGVAGMFTGLIK